MLRLLFLATGNPQLTIASLQVFYHNNDSRTHLVDTGWTLSLKVKILVIMEHVESI